MSENVNLIKIVAFMVICFWTNPTVIAQETSKEFWPEIDIWLKFAPDWRFALFLPLSKNIETNYREGNIVLQADKAWGKTSLFHKTRLLDENRAQLMKAYLTRGGYLEGRSLDDKGYTYLENRAFFEQHIRTPYKGNILIMHRFKTDLRWMGEDNDFSCRLRYRLMAEKEFIVGKSSLVPYVSAEPFFDSRYSTINRFRFITGTTVSWGPRFTYEGNITYQYDSKSIATNTFALNLILHVFFETSIISNTKI